MASTHRLQSSRSSPVLLSPATGSSLLSNGLVDADVTCLEDLLPLGKPLQDGAFGSVTKVWDRQNQQAFVMKTLPKQTVSPSGMKQGVDRQVRMHRRLHHPNILQLYDCIEDESSLHFILEYEQGATLFTELKRVRRFEETPGVSIWTSVARATDYLHSEGIVHGSIRPENVLLCEDGKAKILGFGYCAGLQNVLRSTFSSAAGYIAPELLEGKSHDHLADIWALGSLLYEVLSGELPFCWGSQGAALLPAWEVDVQYPKIMSRVACDLVGKLLKKDKETRLPLKRALTHPLVTSSRPLEASSQTRSGDQGTHRKHSAEEADKVRGRSKTAVGRRRWQLTGLPNLSLEPRSSLCEIYTRTSLMSSLTDTSSLCSIYAPANARSLRNEEKEPFAKPMQTRMASRYCCTANATLLTSTLSVGMHKEPRPRSLLERRISTSVGDGLRAVSNSQPSVCFPSGDEGSGASPIPSCQDVDKGCLDASRAPHRAFSFMDVDDDKDEGTQLSTDWFRMTTDDFCEARDRPGPLATSCLCENIFLPDEIFCRRCGKARPGAVDCTTPGQCAQQRPSCEATLGSASSGGSAQSTFTFAFKPGVDDPKVGAAAHSLLDESTRESEEADAEGIRDSLGAHGSAAENVLALSFGCDVAYRRNPEVLQAVTFGATKSSHGDPLGGTNSSSLEGDRQPFRDVVVRSALSSSIASSFFDGLAFEYGVDGSKESIASHYQVDESVSDSRISIPLRGMESEADAIRAVLGTCDTSDTNELMRSLGGVMASANNPGFLRQVTPGGTKSSSLGEFAFELRMDTPGRDIVPPQLELHH